MATILITAHDLHFGIVDPRSKVCCVESKGQLLRRALTGELGRPGLSLRRTKLLLRFENGRFVDR